jgi:hypothetical protein
MIFCVTRKVATRLLADPPWKGIHFSSLNAELNPTCHLLALLEAHHILHVSRIKVNKNLRDLSGAESLSRYMLDQWNFIATRTRDNSLNFHCSPIGSGAPPL